ncbi:MAG: hypothetical protein HYS20_03865 [Rhodocyclales bacterium]|nr:hypothetical protein [Rhodocyclales bacterium]
MIQDQESYNHLTLAEPFAFGARILDLIAACAGQLPGRGEPPPPELAERMAAWLRDLTIAFRPPEPELVSRFVSYLDGQITRRDEDLPTFTALWEQLQNGFFRTLAPEDFEPLDEGGVEQGIVLFNHGSTAETLRAILEALRRMALVLKKAKEFDAPGQDPHKKVIIKEGPFRVLALGRHVFFNNYKFRDVVKDENPRKMVAQEFQTLHQVPDGTLAVTAELSGLTILSSAGQPVPASGNLGSNFTTVTTSFVGPISANVDVAYSMLKGKTADLRAYVMPHYASIAKEDDWICIRLQIELKYFGLDFS